MSVEVAVRRRSENEENHQPLPTRDAALCRAARKEDIRADVHTYLCQKQTLTVPLFAETKGQ